MIVLILVVVLLFGGLITYIAVHNLTSSAQLDLFLWPTGKYPLGVWLVAAFLCGALVLYLVSVLAALRDRRKMKELRQRVLTLEEQLRAATQASPTFVGQTAEGGLPAASTVPVMSVPNVMSTPQPDGRMPSAPLSSLQNFYQ